MLAEKNQTIYNLEHSREFAAIGNSTLQSSSLSDFSYRLHVYMLSLPSDWRIYRQNLADHFGRSIRTIQTHLTELAKAGLVEYVQLKKRGRRAADGFYRVFEVAKRELKNHKIRVKKPKQKKKQPPQIEPNKLTDLFSQCIERLKKHHRLDDSDVDSLELAYQGYRDTLTTTERPDQVYNWLERSLIHRRKTQERTNAISGKLDRNTATTLATLDRRTASLSTQGLTPRTTQEKLTDRSWADNLNLDEPDY